MGLRTKFNLGFFLVSLVTLGIAGYFIQSVLHSNAREEVLQSARIMMEGAVAVREYTITEIKPLLVIQQTRKFIPQTVPAYAAAEYANRFEKKHPEYSYKEATLNPTNPANKATEWETEIIRWFSDHKDAKELVGERETPTGNTLLYLGRPITIKDPACLYCHDTAAKAPRTLVETYGPDNGFGWKVGETIGSQIVSVPMSLPVARADKTFKTIMFAMCGVFIALFLSMNVMLHFLVVKRVTQNG
ncbi:MAG: DUF3365 domain-containing protein [Lysobacterales bacterium]